MGVEDGLGGSREARGTGITLFLGGGIFASFIQYKLEFFKERRMARRELVKDWRRMIHVKQLPNSNDQYNLVGVTSSNKYAFMDDPAFDSLYSHLTNNFRAQLFDQTIYIVAGHGDFAESGLRNEIARVEREWGLI